jgi:RHS repeat-associated protein
MSKPITDMTRQVNSWNTKRYDYNRAGFITRKTDEHNQATQYQYDELNRFIQIKYPDNRAEVFTYDPMGNIIAKSSSNESVRYNYNKAHQLVSTGDARFDYDLNGNMVKKTINGGTSLYRYDDLSRLREIILPDGQKIDYAYSPLGQRVLQTDKKGQTHFIFDGDNPIANLDHNLRIKTLNTFGPGFDEFLAEESAGKMRYYHQNPLGSVIASSDKAGAQTSQIEYEPFGKPVMVSGVLPPSSFTGRPYDSETGLTHFKFRDYDPTVGRFIQQEPLGLWVAWENSYAYASNNPINMIDMYGLLGTLGWFAAIGTVAIIAAPLVAAYVVGGTAAYVAGIVVATSAATNALGDMKQDEMRGRDSDTMARNAFIGAATGATSAAIGVATGSPAAGAAAGAALGALDAGLTGNSPGWGAASGAVSGIAGGFAGSGAARAVGNLGTEETVQAAEALGGAAVSSVLDYVGAIVQETGPMFVENQIKKEEKRTQSISETEISTWCLE